MGEKLASVMGLNKEIDRLRQENAELIMKGFISHEAGGALEWMLRPEKVLLFTFSRSVLYALLLTRVRWRWINARRVTTSVILICAGDMTNLGVDEEVDDG